MKQLNILNGNDSLLIINSNTNSTQYIINKKDLPQTREGNLSEWVMQLMLKTWISTDILYQLAKIIMKEFPNNKIDWYKTFFIVEKANYLESLEDVLTTNKKSLVDSVFDAIDFGRNETNEETHKIIDEIVSKRLNELEK